MLQQKRIFCLGLMALITWLMRGTSSAGAPPQQTGAGEKNQPVALPVAKEELLGELSADTSVPDREIDAAGSARFGTIRTAKLQPAYVIDPPSLRFTARAKQGKGWVLVVDGKERERAFDGIESVVVSRGGQHIVYSAKRGGQWVRMLDDKELGPPLEEPSGGIWFWSGVRQHYDSLPDFLLPSFLAIAARRGGSKASGLDEVDLPVFSADGQHLAYWARRAKKREFIVFDGKEGPEFEKVGAPHISPDGQRLAYAAKKGKKWVIVADGKEGPQFADVSFPSFSPDGRHRVYAALTGRKEATGPQGEGTEVWVMVVDGGKGPEFEDVSTPVFSPDGQHIAYRGERTTYKGRLEVLMLDGRETGEFEYTGLPWNIFTQRREFDPGGQPVFSPDSQHWAMRAKRENKHLLIIDGKEGGDLDWAPSLPLYSPDSKHVAYLASAKRNFFGVVDGKSLEGAQFAGHSFSLSTAVSFADDLTFSPDSQRLAYVVAWGGQSFVEGRTTRAKRCVVVDGHAGEVYDTLGIDIGFSPDSRHFIYSVRGGVSSDKSTVVTDGQQGKLYEDVIGGNFFQEKARAEAGTSPTEFVYIAREGRKFYRVTQLLP